MTASPKSAYQVSSNLLARLWTEQLVALAIQLADREGTALDRPVPEEWLRRAFDVHCTEKACAMGMLYDLWDALDAEHAKTQPESPPPGE